MPERAATPGDGRGTGHRRMKATSGIDWPPALALMRGRTRSAGGARQLAGAAWTRPCPAQVQRNDGPAHPALHAPRTEKQVNQAQSVGGGGYPPRCGVRGARGARPYVVHSTAAATASARPAFLTGWARAPECSGGCRVVLEYRRPRAPHPARPLHGRSRGMTELAARQKGPGPGPIVVRANRRGGPCPLP